VILTLPVWSVSPMTRSAFPFAVVAIPTPSLSTANRLDPAPTLSVEPERVVVAIPT
jgi:hypothetical protein